MRKVIIYLPSFLGGGAERNSVLLANQFSRFGHEVLIIVDHSLGPNRDLLEPDVAVEELRGTSHAFQLVSLRRLLCSFRPDVVYARVGLSMIKMVIAAFGVVNHQRLVLSYHNPYDPEANIGGRLTYLLASFLTRWAGRTIAVSRDVRHELVSRFKACPARVDVIYNPVDIDWIVEQAQADLPAWLDGRRFILSSGRLISQKDYPTLLRAYAEIVNDVDQDLVIIGEGPLRQDLENLVAELGLVGRVHMPGYQSNPFPIYRHADLFVLASAFEGFGNVLIEAMSLGIPVVATRCPGGPWEILEDGKYGTLVPVGDHGRLSQAIIDNLKLSISRDLLKSRAYDFRLDSVAQQYLGIRIN